MTPSEQERYEPQLEMTFEEKSNFEIPPATQKPYSAGTYKSQYRYVLPDKKQQGIFIPKKSLHQKIQALHKLLQVKKGTYITLHCDNTKEWIR